MSRARLAVAVALAAIAIAFFGLGGDEALNLAALKNQGAPLREATAAYPLFVCATFFLAYVAMAAASLPGAALMTVAAGALFGPWWGTVLVSFASSIGATLALLAARLLFREAVERRYSVRLKAINDGLAKDGAYYLFAMRLVPAVPFFLLNLLMGLTALRTRTFYWVSQLGMLPGTLIYVNAGTQLATIDSAADIASPRVLAGFALLGVAPLILRAGLEWLRRRSVYRPWPRPHKFDRNLIVIGAGSAGLVTAYIAAAVRAKVTLIERGRMGGDCLNTGCVPSKALIRAARAIHQVRRAHEFGIVNASAEVDFAAVMERVRAAIAKIRPHDSPERYRSLGVEVVGGEARLTSPWSVRVADRELTARSIVIATGAAPLVPPIPGLSAAPHCTSDTVWSLRRLPERLLVLGGGPIGCELAQSFARLGSRVVLVEMADRLLPREDACISHFLEECLRREGIEIHTGHRAVAAQTDGAAWTMTAQGADAARTLPFDVVLVALGRRAVTDQLGLDGLGIGLAADGAIETDARLATRYPNIFACGDVVGPYQFTHMASHQAWYAAVNSLFGRFRKFKVDYSVVPWVTFTDPEVARVGLSEAEALAQGVAFDLTQYELDDLDRAIVDGVDRGFVRVLTTRGKDRILGATIVGEHAGELIGAFIAAMRHGHGLNRILRTIHPYPTFSEAAKYTAGAWKRARTPPTVLSWLARYHQWECG